MTDLVLLGAGASAEAGVPGAFDMTQQLVSKVERWSEDVSSVSDRPRYGTDVRRQVASALRFVCAALRLRDEAGGASTRGLDVERVFSAVESLAGRDRLEVAAFVTAWHPSVQAWDSGLRALPNDRADQSSDEGASIYRIANERMLLELRSIVRTRPGQVGYLEPLLQAGRRDSGMTIASLNFDLAVEQCGREARVPVDTGIAAWTWTGRLGVPNSGIYLLKLHGSVDWSWQNDPDSEGKLPSRFLIETSDPSGDDRPPALIFGLHGKLRAEGPFLSLLSKFEDQLNAADRLIVVGYSFRDDHVNQVIRRWTFRRAGHRLVIVDPLFPMAKKSRHRDLAFRDQLLAYLIPDHLATSPFYGCRVDIMRESASEALAMLFDPGGKA